MSTELGVRHPGRREAAGALVVAAVLILVSWLAGPDGASRDVSTLVSASREVVDLDVPGSVTTQQIEQCLTPAFAGGTDDVTVLYGRVQHSEAGDVAALVLRNDTGDLRLCDSFGPDSPARAPLVRASGREPVRYLTNGRKAWECDGARLDGFVASQWLSVARSVARAELRFVLDGQQGPRFRAQAHDGFVHLHGWLGEQPAGVRVSLQQRTFDSAGRVVTQRSEQVSACTGGDMQVG